MADAVYHFDHAKVQRAIEVAQQPYRDRDLRAVSEISTAQPPNLRLNVACISVVSQGNEVCLELPLGLGQVCLPIDLPDGTAAQACLSICTIWGIPTGVCVRVTVGGIELVGQCFGFGC